MDNGYLDDAFLGRVQAAYRRALFSKTSKPARMWGEIGSHQRSVHEALLSNEPTAIRAIFSDPIRSNLFYGVDNLAAEVSGKILDNHSIVTWTEQYSRKELTALAQTVGAADEPEALIESLDKLLRQRVLFPTPFRGDLGFPTSRGVASYRAIQSIYQAWRTSELLGSNRGSVIEIGPGMGRAAYYAFKSGCTDYTTIDLPLGIVRQACFLGATLGPDHLWFEGEDPASRAGQINLLVAGHYPDRTFDLAVNVDGFTEITVSSAIATLRWMGTRVTTFLSINHEVGRFTVTEIAYALGLRHQSKFPCPIREGYMEEIFKIPNQINFAWPFKISYIPRRIIARFARLSQNKSAIK